jgi:hypothetical protein
MPETYNPRERTFIRMPEVKCCTACGQPLPSEVKPMNNVMSRYTSLEGMVRVCNSDDDVLEVKQGDTTIKLYKLIKHPDTKKEYSPFLPVPPTSITPNPTTVTPTK